jgi:hypothetical protein
MFFIVSEQMEAKRLSSFPELLSEFCKSLLTQLGNGITPRKSKSRKKNPKELKKICYVESAADFQWERGSTGV